MRSISGWLVVLALTAGLGAPAAAAPVGAALVVSIQGLAPITLLGGGSVGVSGSTVTIPAGLVSQVGSLTIPLTSTTSATSLVASGIANLAATFSVGGVTAQAPGEVCPGGGPAAGQACNAGGALGGVMGLTGVIEVHVIPHIVVIPVSLAGVLVGQGGSTASSPFTIDAAAWTTGAGFVNTGNSVASLDPANPPASLLLVTPTYVSALGNLLPIFAHFLLSGGIPLPVPEPASGLAIGLGLGGLTCLARTRHRP